MHHNHTSLVFLALAQDIAKLLQRAPDELGVLPEVGGEETVAVDDGNEGGLEGVLEGLGGAGGRGVSILDTGQLEETLDGGGGNETGTAGGGNELRLLLVAGRGCRGRKKGLYIREPRRNRTCRTA